MNPIEFDMALQRPVFYMMRRGIRVNRTLRDELRIQYKADWDKTQILLNTISGHPVNVQSPKQMKELFYTELGLPPRVTDGKVTTNEDAIRASMAFAYEKVNTSTRDETKTKWLRAWSACKLTLKIREMRKMMSSYLNVPLDTDGRARCTISVGGTETMRFSHSKTLWDTGLNLATVPHKLRPIFIADEDYELSEFDLNRGESWVYTFLSQDPELLRIHTGGLDFHAETASAIQGAFGRSGLSADDIRALAKAGDQFGYRIRYLGKKVNHASAYRMGPFRATEVINEESDDTGITVVAAQMKKAQNLWRQKYFGIEGWWNSIDRELESSRTLVTPYGRKRTFYGFMNDHLKKEATAYVPQSTSVDFMNRGMLRVFDELVTKNAWQLELLHQNHDSILVQYPKQYRNEVHAAIKECLTSSVVIRGETVTIPTDGSYGQNWGDFHKDKNPEGLKELKAA